MTRGSAEPGFWLPVFEAPCQEVPLTLPMSRYDRLERWAMLLERAPASSLTPFRDVGLRSEADRLELQIANSPFPMPTLCCAAPGLLFCLRSED